MRPRGSRRQGHSARTWGARVPAMGYALSRRPDWSTCSSVYLGPGRSGAGCTALHRSAGAAAARSSSSSRLQQRQRASSTSSPRRGQCTRLVAPTASQPDPSVIGIRRWRRWTGFHPLCIDRRPDRDPRQPLREEGLAVERHTHADTARQPMRIEKVRAGCGLFADEAVVVVGERLCATDTAGAHAAAARPAAAMSSARRRTAKPTRSAR